MSDGLTRSMCAHLRVKYNPIDHDNGSASDRWSCELCGHDFWPKLWLFPAPWMRERPAEPKLPPSEKAELQVSLLNEIGLTLAAMARALADAKTLANQRFSLTLAMSENVGDIRDVLHIHRLSLEGIQGLLVDNEAGIGTLGEGMAAILARLDHDSIAGLWERLKRIEERLDKFDVWFDSWNELRAAALEAGQMEIRQMQAKQRSSSGAEANNQKPRKAGKRKGKRK